MAEKVLRISQEPEYTYQLTRSQAKLVFSMLEKGIEERESEIAALLKQIEPLTSERNQMEFLMKKLRPTMDEDHLNEPEHNFQKTMTRAEKARFAIIQAKKPLSLNEVVDYIGKNYEPEIISDPIKLRETIGRYATSLKSKIEEKDSFLQRAKVIRDDNYEYVYGLADWFMDGNLKKEFFG